MVKGNNVFFYERSLFNFLFLNFFLGLSFKFFKVPFYIAFFFLIILVEIWQKGVFIKKRSLILYGVLSFSIGYFYLLGYEKLKLKRSIDNREFNLFFKVLKIEPYYGKNYKVWIDTTQGVFTFTIDKKIFTPGDFCIAYFKEKTTKKYLNPFSFSKAQVLFVQGIKGELILNKSKPIVCEPSSFNLEKIRYRLFEFSNRLSPQAKGLFQALVLGVDRDFPSEYIESLKAQGLYHMLAISGYNLGILFGIFYFFWRCVLSLLALRFSFIQPIQLYSYILALPGAFLILIFSGFVPSANRAFVFLLLFVISKILFRNTPSITLLFLTAFLILIYKPFYVGNYSFLLSFLATLGLLLGNRIYNELFSFVKSNSNIFGKALFNIGRSIFISIVVSILIFPIILYLSGSFPLGTPLNNIIAGIFWGFIFIPFSIFCAILAFIQPDLGLKLAWILEKSFVIYNKIPFIEILFKLNLPINFVILLSFFVIPFILFVLWKKEKALKKVIFKISLSTGIIFVGLFYFYHKIPMIIVFDMGKADAILIKIPSSFKSYYVLWDTGPNFYNYKNFNWTKFYFVPVLEKLGINYIDLIVISHPDLDHSGGLNTLIKYFEVGEVVSGNFDKKCWEKVRLSSLEIIKPLKTFCVKKLGDGEFFFYPYERTYFEEEEKCKNLNTQSLVGIFEYKGFSMIFPGDIDVDRFLELIYTKSIFPVEVLLCPHHGSKYGLNSLIIEKLKPNIALISGRGRYFPHPSIITLLKNKNLYYLTTSSSGAIYLFPKKGYFLVCEEKNKRKSFWSNLFFPFIHYYLEDKSCKKFSYHSFKILEN